MANVLRTYPIDFRRAIMRTLERNSMWLAGHLADIDFLRKVMDLNALPSTDSRFENAYDDMWQHTVNNHDWTSEDIWSDARFDPLKVQDECFERMINAALCADTRQNHAIEDFALVISPVLEQGGLKLERIEPYGVFEGYRLVLGDIALLQCLHCRSSDLTR